MGMNFKCQSIKKNYAGVVGDDNNCKFFFNFQRHLLKYEKAEFLF